MWVVVMKSAANAALSSVLQPDSAHGTAYYDSGVLHVISPLNFSDVLIPGYDTAYCVLRIATAYYVWGNTAAWCCMVTYTCTAGNSDMPHVSCDSFCIGSHSPHHDQ